MTLGQPHGLDQPWVDRRCTVGTCSSTTSMENTDLEVPSRLKERLGALFVSLALIVHCSQCINDYQLSCVAIPADPCHASIELTSSSSAATAKVQKHQPGAAGALCECH